MPHRDGPPPWAHADHWGHAAGAGGFLPVLITLAWIVLLIWLAWLALRWLAPYIRPRLVAMLGPAPGAPASTSAFEILRQRYAAGEIDDSTFERMWERLEASYQQEPFDALPASDDEQRALWTTRIRRTAPLWDED